MTESTTRRILLIDDDPSLLEVLRYQLSEAGHEVDAHSDSTAAVAAFDPAVHQLVISDLKMPTLDGLGV